MSFEIIIIQAANIDTTEAYNYYEEKLPGLGDRFLQELVQRYNDISLHPEYYGFIDEQEIIRDVKLKHFPFLIVYEINGNNVIIFRF